MRDFLNGCWVLGNGLPLVEVNIGLLADQVGVSATDTLDLGQGVHDLLLAYFNCQTMILFIVGESRGRWYPEVGVRTDHRRWC